MRPAECVAGRFELEREAGTGGMGTVWQARDLATGARVAVKFLHAGQSPLRFEQEARFLAELAHPGIVRYVAHGSTGLGAMFLAMEWLEGEDLAERLARGALTAGESVALGLRVAQALGAAHSRGVVHRDLKPANLFLVGHVLEDVRIIDFGIAFGARGGTRRTRTGVAIGTPEYMAPEQARGERTVDARADVFSLGCVLYECVTGRPPFVGLHVMAVLAKVLLEEPPRARELRPDVPDALDALLDRMLSKKPEGRPASGAEVATLLGAWSDRGAGPRMATGRARATALTGADQRLVSVLVLGSPAVGDAVTLGADEAAVVPASIAGAAATFGARVEKLVDGSTVVLLPAGGTAADQAARAAACALALRAAALDAPMALATGLAETDERMPVGDAIDRAARLVELGERGALGPPPIRMDDVSAALLDDRFHWRQDSDGAVLLGRREADAVRTLLGKPTPCVGRDAELAMLEAALGVCVSEPVARVILVTARPGVGKSRLRHEFLRRVRARSEKVEVWVARGDPVGGGSAFGLAAEAIRRTAGVFEGEPVEVRREKIRARVARLVPEERRARVAAFLGEMIGAPFPADLDVQLRSARQDAILMGDQIRRAWEDFVEAELAAHPVLLVLEDLHWGDLPTVTLVDAALRLFVDRPLMVLALARPEVSDLFPHLWDGRDLTTLALAALGRKAAEQLVLTVLGQAASTAPVSRIVELAAGNAFYLEELIRSVAEGKGDALPETVVAMVQSRLDVLEPEARRLLRAASVFGTVFWESGIALLLGRPEESTESRRCLDGLARSEILTRRSQSKFAGEVEYVFRHALMREGAYAMLTGADRALGHRVAAGWLETVGETAAIAIAEHLERGGELPRAAAAFRRAAEQSLEGNDLAAAIARAERGVAASADAELRGALRRLQAEAYRWRGEFVEAERCGEEALGLLVPGTGLWLEATEELAAASAHLGRDDRLAAIGEGMLALLFRAPGDPRAARAAARVAIALYMVGQIGLGHALLDAAEVAAAGSSDPTVQARIQSARGRRALQAGRPAELVRRLTAALASFDEAGDSRNACSMRHNLGFSLIELGAHEAAEGALTDALATAERMGLRILVAAAQNNLGWLRFRRGLLDGTALVEAAVESFQSQGDHRMQGGSRAHLGAILARAGDLAAAERETRAAALLLEPFPPLRPHALAVLARVLLAAGRPAEALEAAREAISVFEKLGYVEEGDALVHLALVEALDGVGDGASARSALAIARDRLLARAEAIDEPKLRANFLENIAENARTLELAAVWLDATSD